MSSTQILKEALSKIDYTNLRENLFAIDAESQAAERDAYLNANKVGHLAPDAPKIPDVAVNIQRVLNKGALKEIKRTTGGGSKKKSDSYSYEDSQRRLTRKHSKYQAIDRTVIFNQMTSRVSEAVSASVVSPVATASKAYVKENKLDLLARITEMTNRIMLMQEEANENVTIVPVKAAEPEVELEPEKPDLSVVIHDLVEISIEYHRDMDQILCGFKIPIHILEARSERDARRIVNRAAEEFKFTIVHLVTNPGGEQQQQQQPREKIVTVQRARFSEIKSSYSFKVVQNSGIFYGKPDQQQKF
jgi:hypothetical protein